NVRCGRNEFPQQPKLLRPQLRKEEGDAGRISARPGETADEAKCDWIVSDTEHQWNCRGCRLGRQCRSCTAGRDDDGYLTAAHLRGHHRQPIVLTFGPVGFDPYVATLDVAGFGETLAKGGHDLTRRTRRCRNST